MGRLLWCPHSLQILHPDDLLASLEESLSCHKECSQWQTIGNRWQHDPVKKNKQTNKQTVKGLNPGVISKVG